VVLERQQEAISGSGRGRYCVKGFEILVIDELFARSPSPAGDALENIGPLGKMASPNKRKAQKSQRLQ
jgi:hypothetical protein